LTRQRNEDDEAYYKRACDKGWEGVVAKRAESKHRHSRSRDWLKFKCGHAQELVIGVLTEPRGGRVGFGALPVGVDDDGRLRYAGKVGIGHDDAFLVDFRERFERIATEAPSIRRHAFREAGHRGQTEVRRRVRIYRVGPRRQTPASAISGTALRQEPRRGRKGAPG
jgi:bifunctional non-homologous end joining protein LigD